METVQRAFENVLLELDPIYNYQESVYQATIAHYLSQLLPGNFVALEVDIPYVLSDGFYVGRGRADIVVELASQVIIIELKRGFFNLGRARAQVRRYVRHYNSEKEIIGCLCLFTINPVCERVV